MDSEFRLHPKCILLFFQFKNKYHKTSFTQRRCNNTIFCPHFTKTQCIKYTRVTANSTNFKPVSIYSQRSVKKEIIKRYGSYGYKLSSPVSTSSCCIIWQGFFIDIYNTPEDIQGLLEYGKRTLSGHAFRFFFYTLFNIDVPAKVKRPQEGIIPISSSLQIPDPS